MSKQTDPKSLIKVYRFLEKFWLAVAIISTGLSIYIVAKDGVDKAWIYLFLPTIAVALWFMRRRLRISYERMLEKEQSSGSEE